MRRDGTPRASGGGAARALRVGTLRGHDGPDPRRAAVRNRRGPHRPDSLRSRAGGRGLDRPHARRRDPHPGSRPRADSDPRSRRLPDAHPRRAARPAVRPGTGRHDPRDHAREDHARAHALWLARGPQPVRAAGCDDPPSRPPSCSPASRTARSWRSPTSPGTRWRSTPGERICQLVVLRTQGSAVYRGRFADQDQI